MKKLTFLLVLLLAISANTYSQKLENQLDALMVKQYRPDGPGAVALVVKDGKILYRKAFGMANLELDVEMKPESVFRIGSITKQFTAVAILKLRDQGKLSLDDELTKYIKDYPTDGNTVTIKHLLTHTSGVKSYTSMPEFDVDIRKKDFAPLDFINFFKDQPLDFKPGEEWRYSNSGYFILGYIIEVASGMKYEEYITKTFFETLGMTSSYYGSPNRIIKNRTNGYGKRNGNLINTDYLSMTTPYAAGALLSTVDDLYKWSKAIMDNEIVSETSKEEAHSTYVLNNGEKTGYGYGWSIGNIQGSQLISHGGGINGFLTSSMFLPEEKVFVAILGNSDFKFPGQIARKMAAIAIGKPYDWNSIPVAEDKLKSYEAVYEAKKDKQLIITFKKGKLFALRTGGSKQEIVPYATNKFFFVNNKTETLHFSTGTNEAITSVTSKSTDYDVNWLRTEKPIPTIKKIEVDPKIAETYLGRYALAPTFFLSIFQEQDKMYLQATGQGKVEIVPFEENKFNLVDIDAKLTFNKDESGKIVSLTLHQNGNHEAKKLE